MTGYEPRPIGRPDLLTEEMTRNLTAALRTGMTYKRAAIANGIGARTLDRWLAEGREAAQLARADIVLHTPEGAEPRALAEADLSDERIRKRWRLWQSLEGARAQMVQDALLRIRQAGQGTTKRTTVTRTRMAKGVEVVETTVTEEHGFDWKADAWLLERMLPGEFSRRTVVEHAGEGGGPVQLAVGPMRDLLRADLARLANEMELPSDDDGPDETVPVAEGDALPEGFPVLELGPAPED